MQYFGTNIIHSFTINHFERKNILTKCQHSLTNVMWETNDHDRWWTGKGTKLEAANSDTVLLDFSKAFDKVPHHWQILKQQHYGAVETSWRWKKTSSQPELNRWLSMAPSRRLRSHSMHNSRSTATCILSLLKRHDRGCMVNSQTFCRPQPKLVRCYHLNSRVLDR